MHPDDIEHQSFYKSMWGYEAGAVDRYLERVAEEVRYLRDELVRMSLAAGAGVPELDEDEPEP